MDDITVDLGCNCICGQNCEFINNILVVELFYLSY